MKKYQSTIAVLVIMLILSPSLSVAYRNIDTNVNTWASLYSLSMFKKSYIQSLILKQSKNAAAFLREPHNYMYDRFQAGKPSKEDLLRKEEYCHGDKTCETEKFFRSIRWTSSVRDATIRITDEKVIVFQDIVNQNNWWRPLDYIWKQYWEDIYATLISKRSLLDAQFDKFIESERKLVAEWKYKAIMDGSWIQKEVQEYGLYVSFIGYEKLDGMRNKAKTNLVKAVFTYFIYRLLSDERLYIAQ